MKKLLSVITTAALLAGCLAPEPSAFAATGDPTAIGYVDTMYKNMNAASSIGMKVDASLVYGAGAASTQTDTVKLTADILSLIPSEETAVTANIDLGLLLGITAGKQNMKLELYNVKSADGGYDIYTYDTSTWEKEHVTEAEWKEASTSASSSVAQNPMDFLSNLAVAADPQNVEGKDCVIVTGEITGQAIADLWKAGNQSSLGFEDTYIRDLQKQKKAKIKQRKKLSKKLKKAKSQKKKKRLKKAVKQTKKEIKLINRQIKALKQSKKQDKKEQEELYKQLTTCSSVKYTFSIEKATNNPVKLDIDGTAFLQSYLAIDPETKELAAMLQSCNASVIYHSINAVPGITVPAEAQNAKSAK